MYASEIKTKRMFRLDDVPLSDVVILTDALSEYYTDAPSARKERINQLWTQLDELRQEALGE